MSLAKAPYSGSKSLAGRFDLISQDIATSLTHFFRIQRKEMTCLTSMSQSSNPIPFLETLREILANPFHDSSIVTADERAVIADSVKSGPVCGIERNGYGPDQQIVVSESRDGNGPEGCMAYSFSDQSEILHVRGNGRTKTLLEWGDWQISVATDCASGILMRMKKDIHG